MSARKKKHQKQSDTPRIKNRRARFDYHVDESFECGLALSGSEVKSIRAGHASIGEAFARVEPKTMELWLYNMEVGAYANASADGHEPKRARKLLVHRREIRKLLTVTASKGMTLIPLTLYFNDRGFAKIELGICSGKQLGDKREAITKRETDIAIRRGMSRKRIG